MDLQASRPFLLAALVVVGLLAGVWVYRPVFQGPAAARRDVGSVRLSLGCLAVVFLLNTVLTLPFAPLFRGEALTSSTFLLAALATQAPMLLVLYTRLIASGAVTWRDLGLVPLPFDRVLVRGLATGLASLVLSAVIGLFLSQFGIQQNQLDQFAFVRNEGQRGLVVALVSGSVFAPFVEELFFRGFVFGQARRFYPTWAAYLISGGVFAVLHVNPTVMDLSQMFGLVVAILGLGSLYAWTYVRTGSLYPSMLAHAANNTVALLAVSSLPVS